MADWIVQNRGTSPLSLGGLSSGSVEHCCMSYLHVLLTVDELWRIMTMLVMLEDMFLWHLDTRGKCHDERLIFMIEVYR